MSDWDDLDGVTPPISNEDAERLLTGTFGIGETPQRADLSSVIGALRAPGEPAELAGLPSVLAAFGAAVVTAHPDPSIQTTIPMRRKRLTGKTLAAIGVFTLVSAGAAAAAGVVPSPFSSSKPPAATSHDTDADDSTDESDAEDTAVDTTPTTDEVEAVETTAAAETTEADEVGVAAEPADATVDTDGQGPDVNGPAKFGLCNAYAARTKHDDVTITTVADATATAEPEGTDSDLPLPFQNLTDAADTAGQTVAEFCADAIPGGSADAPEESGDNPSATAPGHSDDKGKSGDNPSATAPGRSGGAPGNSGDHGHSSTTQP